MNQIENLLAPFSEKRCPGCAIAVVRNGIPVLERLEGYADREKESLISRKTNFRLASVSKQFIAIAILVLIEKNEISASNNLLDFFPDFPSYGKHITVHHLLTHSAGLFDYENLIPQDYHGQVLDEDVLDLLKKQTGTMFVPGKHYSYSNGGYCLLRIIIEKVSGQVIESFLKENLFDPLGMDTATVNHQGITVIPHRAYGYSKDGSTWKQTNQDKTSATIGDGGVYASIQDMQRWADVFYTDKVLSKKSRDLLTTKHIRTDEGIDVWYGYGVFLKEEFGKKIAYHGGSSIGFQTGTYYALDDQMAAFFLSNRTGESGSEIAEKIALQYQKEI